MDCGVKSFVHWCQSDKKHFFPQVHVVIGEERWGFFCLEGVGFGRRETVFIMILSCQSKEV